jgi:transcriptional regulator with XRE-family HTH domain
MVGTQQRPAHPNALQELVLAHCDATGDTLSDIAERAGLSRQTLSALMHRPNKGNLPRTSTLDRLAVGLGVSPRTVRDAAQIAVLGLNGDDEPYDRRVVVLIDQARRLSPQQVEVLLATARALQALDTTP